MKKILKFLKDLYRLLTGTGTTLRVICTEKEKPQVRNFLRSKGLGFGWIIYPYVPHIDELFEGTKRSNVVVMVSKGMSIFAEFERIMPHSLSKSAEYLRFEDPKDFVEITNNLMKDPTF